MFEDFGQSATVAQARKRFRSSIVAAAVIYGTSSAAMVAATRAITKPVEEPEPVITWRPPPPVAETPSEPPPSLPVTNGHPKKATKATARTPKQVPKDKPPESDGPLTTSEGKPVERPGPNTGDRIGSTLVQQPPPPPPARPEPLMRPIAIRSDDRPMYPHGARRKGIEGTVVVAFIVLEDGRVTNVRILSGPKELHESVLEAAAFWRYKPARRGGKAVRYSMTKSVLFRLEDA